MAKLPPIEEIEKKGGFWDFETLDSTNYQCVLYFVAKDRMSKLLLKATLKALKLKNRVKYDKKEVMEKYDNLKEFDVDSRYYNFLKTKLGGLMKGTTKEIAKDGYGLLSFKVDRCTFVRHKNKWLIKMFISGIYGKDL